MPKITLQAGDPAPDFKGIDENGHLYTCAHLVDRGLIKPPLFVQSVFGILGGIGPHPEDVAHMKRTADRLFGDNYLDPATGKPRTVIINLINANSPMTFYETLSR